MHLKNKILCLSCFLFSSWGQANTPNIFKAQQLGKKLYSVCGVKLSLEVAKTPEERSMGLMYRDSISSKSGMIFIFDKPDILSFWMKNVSFDIDIAYFNSQGQLLNYVTMAGTSTLMKTEALPTYPSRGPALFAVEVEKGFFSRLLPKNLKTCTLKALN